MASRRACALRSTGPLLALVLSTHTAGAAAPVEPVPVIAICLLRKEKWIMGGATLGFAATLQLFPVVCVATVALAAAVDWRRLRRWPTEGVRILLGAVAMSIVLVVLSPFVAGRHQAWSEFSANTKKHAETPSANLVGLPTALSFRPSTRAALLFDEDAVDPFARVRAARLENLRPLKPVRRTAGRRVRL
jgi:hypothetical protein